MFMNLTKIMSLERVQKEKDIQPINFSAAINSIKFSEGIILDRAFKAIREMTQ